MSSLHLAVGLFVVAVVCAVRIFAFTGYTAGGWFGGGDDRNDDGDDEMHGPVRVWHAAPVASDVASSSGEKTGSDGSTRLRLNREMARRCGADDGCRVSRYLVDQVGLVVGRMNSVPEAAAYLRNHADEFTSARGDYVWIHTRTTDSSPASSAYAYAYAYHADTRLDGRTAAEAQRVVEGVVADVPRRADVGQILSAASDAADRSPDGVFVEYVWFDPRTHDTVLKRSFVRRLAPGIYAGSGASSSASSSASASASASSSASASASASSRDNGARDVGGVLILGGAFVGLTALWSLLRIDANLPVARGAIAYAAVCAVFVAVILRSNPELRPRAEEVAQLRKTDDVALRIAGMSLSLSLFATHALKKSRVDACRPSVVPVLVSAFILLLPVLLPTRDARTANHVRRTTQVKFSILLVSVSLLSAAMLLVGSA
jgi:hypothetical protein